MLAPGFSHAMDTFFIYPENILMAFSAGYAAEGLIRGPGTYRVETVAVSADRRLEGSPLHQRISPWKRKIIMDGSSDLRRHALVAFPAHPGNGDRVFPPCCVSHFR